MIYDKFTGTQTGGANLLTIIQGIVVDYGFTVEFYGDNIISAINLGKKLILKKGSIYYYLAASDNNNPVRNTTSFVNNQISSLKMCQGTTYNSTNNWYLNNLSSTSVLDIPGCEYKPNKTYTIYINNDNLILVNNFDVGLYSSMIMGNMKKLGTNDNVSLLLGSNKSSTDLVSKGRLLQNPLLQPYLTMGSVIKGSVAIPPSSLRVNNFSWGETIDDYLCYLTERTGYINNQYYDMNRGYSTDLGITYTFDYVVYTYDGYYYKRLMTYDELRIVNMHECNPGDQITDGGNIYEVWPFLKKEVPHIYSNDETWGLGFAVKVAGV